jgi:leucyl aminopeptidase
MGNDRALIAALVAAGKQGGERLWELPLVRDYRPDLESDVADLANVAAGGTAARSTPDSSWKSSSAGLPWAHLDMRASGSRTATFRTRRGAASASASVC